ncbi:MAG: hypothetical protein NVS4B11_20770 [Ktedonobacteraceae bacterium]
MNTLKKLYLFEKILKEQRTPEKAGSWSSVWQGKQVPFAFARVTLLTSEVGMLAIAVLIGMTHASTIVILGMELLFVCVYLLLLFARICKQFWPVIGVYLVVIGLAIILNLAFPGTWGNALLYVLCVIVSYRFPLVWSLPLVVVCLLTLILTGGAVQLLLVQHSGNLGILAFNLVLCASLCWFGWTRRTQYLLVVKLHEVQEQLREQMLRSEALATERERTRIARDIHDVLSHSLAVLSIQVQAARSLMVRDPERLVAKLDDMATLIRESITESRRVVGLLREKPLTTSEPDGLGASLQSLSTTFNARTGIDCRFEESGTSHMLSPQQRETLHLALREMLTNAHRHGTAQAVWITLRWREASIILEVRDNGTGADLAYRGTHEEEMGNGTNAVNGTGGHHGLQGMRERAAVLGGEVEAGPTETGGFTVTLKLPFEQPSERFTQKVK